MRRLFAIWILGIAAACGGVAQSDATATSTAFTATSAGWTETPSPIPTATETPTPTISPAPTITPSPTVTLTPTFAFPVVSVNQQAHCRYGPSIAYLHAADLYPGDTGTVRGRFMYSGWLFVKFDKLKYFCWVAPSVVEVVGDITTLYYTEPDLPSIGTNKYGPPKGVVALREGGQVTISWNQVLMSRDKDRGYFIEAFVCQDGALLWWTVSFPDQYTTSYTVKDEAGCAEPSHGELYTVEKDGYSKPVIIPWPAP